MARIAKVNWLNEEARSAWAAERAARARIVRYFILFVVVS
jgi:hypothetical protein